MAAAAVIAPAMVFACIAILLFPHQAQAKSYEMPKVSIAAEAQTDGSLRVVEARTFEFNGDFTAVWWTFSDLPSNAKLVVNGVHLSFDSSKDETGSIFGDGSSDGVGSSANSDSSAGFDANRNGGSNPNFDIDLTSVSFRESWRDEGGPGTEAYSLDEQQSTVYVFFDASDETITVTLDYTVENGVQAYKDMAEVYWKYVGDGWEEASCDVSMTLILPVASGASVVPGNTVRAWGHGPLDGVVSVGDDGTVTYTVPKVKAGQYAEARVLFPVSWLTNLSSKAAQLHKDTARLDTVLSEESVWADQANRQRVLSLALVVACGVVCALLLVWALWLYFRHGKEHKPDFTGKYWRNIPDRSLHPAVVGRLWRWNREDSADFTTALINLARIGAICIDRGGQGGGVWEAGGGAVVGQGASQTVPVQNAGMQGLGAQVAGIQGAGVQAASPQVVGEYRITRLPEAESVAVNPVDQAALTFLFDTVAGGRAWLWSGDIERYGESHAEEFVDGMKAWQDALSAEVDARGFFEPKSSRWQVRMIVVAVVLFLLGVAISISQDNFVPLIFVVPTSIVLAVLANYMPRRSVYGNNVVAKCKALRNWLRDFSSLGERLPADAQVWGEFMLYAYVFGIADEVMGQLHMSVPQLFGEGTYGYGSYVPWWLWYETGYSGESGTITSVVGALQESVSSTIDAAQAAISGSSDGSGGGGGFSGGGGDGFGGGGGAR